MHQNRKGSAEQAKGSVNGAAGGKIFGDKTLETEGNADKATASFKNTDGGLKRSARGG